jgi:uracil-DNA glycosylase
MFQIIGRMSEIILHESWHAPLRSELQADYMTALLAFLDREKAAGKVIFPPEADWFHALALTPLDKVRVVILGQDPYPGAGKAHGLSFSVNPGVSLPPSLRNIYKELQSDLGIAPAAHGCLASWAQQGVLLLNYILTVEKGIPLSHRKRGWERFTSAVLALVNASQTPVIFMLWGDKAKAKAGPLDDVAQGGKHLVLATSHPSPMGNAYNRGFKGCRHFSQCNAFLQSHGLASIDWVLPADVA